MHVHILGICGTFMGGIAALARQHGHTVSGSDRGIYPPMSDQLARLGIAVSPLDDLDQFDPEPDVVVVGNVMSRGYPAVEHLLNARLPFTSGPEWLARHVLRERKVIAVAGTHGKTTTASLVAWLLDSAGLAPGFLIGGVSQNFDVSARLGDGEWFVVEADEYDTAFFDKRSKFVHYGPTVAVLNNLEYDHADIFPDLDAIKTQFHHLVRTVPGNGSLVVNADDVNLADVLKRGAWTPITGFGEHAKWRAVLDNKQLGVSCDDRPVARVPWALPGSHNAANAAAACAAVCAAGVDASQLAQGLATFGGVKRRAELVGEAADVRVYDDFAHHPTAVRLTLEGFRPRVGQGRLLAVVELRSNTMKLGVHASALSDALDLADLAWICAAPGTVPTAGRAQTVHGVDALLEQVINAARAGDTIVVMSNGGFSGFSRRLAEALAQRA